MTLPFYKYQGTGNDFVIVDNRNPVHLNRSNTHLISHLCDRRFGIGADGLILLQDHPDYDFEMVYFNSDGNESTMCGNGGRCIVAFARFLGLIKGQTHFLAIDGPHDARIETEGWIALKMIDVPQIENGEDFYLMNTGSPHYVIFTEDIDDINVVENGQAIRYSNRFRKEGVNVNFVEKTKSGITVATYERGVEDETLSCGTGVTAAAIAYALEKGVEKKGEVDIQTKGGALKVLLEKDQAGGGFQDVWLCGPATQVFSGIIVLRKGGLGVRGQE